MYSILRKSCSYSEYFDKSLLNRIFYLSFLFWFYYYIFWNRHHMYLIYCIKVFLYLFLCFFQSSILMHLLLRVLWNTNSPNGYLYYYYYYQNCSSNTYLLIMWSFPYKHHLKRTNCIIKYVITFLWRNSTNLLIVIL